MKNNIPVLYGRQYASVHELNVDQKVQRQEYLMSQISKCCIQIDQSDLWCNGCLEKLLHVRWLIASIQADMGNGKLFGTPLGYRFYPMLYLPVNSPDKDLKSFIDDFNSHTLSLSKHMKGNSDRWKKDLFLGTNIFKI